MSVAHRVFFGFVLVLLSGALAYGVYAEEDPAPTPADPPAPAGGPQPAAEPPQLGNRVTENGQRVGREQMWRAPTAEDWAKPVLIKFQRTWDDAVAVSKETGKPILICINMDGEIASEHYAGVRYRQPEIAELYKPYVCVIASVYRHNPRDHDDQGRRILCPRFGSVTCGEHISIEPVIYEKYCEEKRIAPRHIAIDLAKNEVYDVYYANDTASVFDAIREGPADLPPPKPEIIRGDRPILERVASRHADDRNAVEAAYAKGDEALKKALLDAAIQHGDAAQLDLLRMAIFGLDVDLSRLARTALAGVDDAGATQLISESMQVPMDPAEREALIAALQRLGESSKLASWLAGVHQGLETRSDAVDTKGWADLDPKTATPTVTPDADALTAQAEYQAQAVEAYPDDPGPRLQLAEANLSLALEAPRTYVTNPRMVRLVQRHLYADARKAAEEAEKLGATGWGVESILTLAAYYAGDLDTAYARAEKAMKALPAGDTGWRSMAVVTIFAESRWKAIKAAVKAKQNWPSEYLADLHAAYGVLLKHPLGTDGQVIWHYEFLVWLGAEHRATRVLRDGLARWPHSPALQERLRKRLLKRRGPEALETVSTKMADDAPDDAILRWYAGVGAVHVAEHHRNQGKYEQAVAAYERAIEHYEHAVKLDEVLEDSVDQVVALALAGRARVAYQLGADEHALQDILASFERSPSTAGTRDGMGITPGETAQILINRLREAKRADLVEALQKALDALDQELLLPDRY